MATLYKRMYEITISEPLISPDDYKIPPLISKLDGQPQNSQDYNTTDSARQVVITDLDVIMKIEKTRSASTNNLDLTIYNLSESTQALLRVKGAMVIVKAGYESLHGTHSNLPTLFIGQVDNVEVSKQDTRVATRVRAADGLELLKNQRISYEAEAGAKVTDVVRDLALGFNNVVEGHLALQDIEGEVFPTGYSAFGILKDVLGELCKSRQLRYSIENNSIYVYPEAWFRVAEEVGAIPYNSTEAKAWESNVSRAKIDNFNKGVILQFTPSEVISAKVLTERRAAKNGSAKDTNGVTLIIPTYTKFNTAIDRVRLTEEFDTNISGDYTIESVDMSLESRDGEWITTLELTADSD